MLQTLFPRCFLILIIFFIFLRLWQQPSGWKVKTNSFLIKVPEIKKQQQAGRMECGEKSFKSPPFWILHPAQWDFFCHLIATFAEKCSSCDNYGKSSRVSEEIVCVCLNIWIWSRRVSFPLKIMRSMNISTAMYARAVCGRRHVLINCRHTANILYVTVVLSHKLSVSDEKTMYKRAEIPAVRSRKASIAYRKQSKVASPPPSFFVSYSLVTKNHKMFRSQHLRCVWSWKSNFSSFFSLPSNFWFTVPFQVAFVSNKPWNHHMYASIWFICLHRSECV